MACTKIWYSDQKMNGLPANFGVGRAYYFTTMFIIILYHYVFNFLQLHWTNLASHTSTGLLMRQPQQPPLPLRPILSPHQHPHL